MKMNIFWLICFVLWLASHAYLHNIPWWQAIVWAGGAAFIILTGGQKCSNK